MTELRDLAEEKRRWVCVRCGRVTYSVGRPTCRHGRSGKAPFDEMEDAELLETWRREARR